MKHILVFTIISLITFFSAFSQEVFKAKQINVFKNGTYFILKEGTPQINNKKAIISFKNQPLLGTFWISSSNDAVISNIVFKSDTLKTNKTAKNFTDLLQANKNKKIKIAYKIDDKSFREISGTLTDFIKSSDLVKIKTNDNKSVFLHANNIIELTIDENVTDKFSEDSVMNVALVEFSKSSSNTKLKMYYMQQGIQWIPMYNIKLINDKELMLEMKAVVENFSENIQNAELTLTVGNPQFFFGKTLDPVAYKYFSNITSSYSTSSKNDFMPVQSYALSNAYYTQESRSNDNTADETKSEYFTEGEKTNDLYMYNIGIVSLPENTKTTFNVFASKINYDDVYEVNIDDISNYYYNRYTNNDPDKRYDVFHSIKLSNSTSNPFTTAPVFVVNDKNQPIAQDRLKYTPLGGTVSVQLSEAGDIVVKNTEEEINITENAKKIGKIIYRLVQIKGEIEIENLQPKNIKLNVNKSLTAKIIKVSDNGKITKSGKYSDLNAHTKAEWELLIKNNEKKTLIYEYEVYIRSN